MVSHRPPRSPDDGAFFVALFFCLYYVYSPFVSKTLITYIYCVVFSLDYSVQRYEETLILQKYFDGSEKVCIFASSFNRQKDQEKARFSIPLSVKLGHFHKGIKSE